MNMPEKRDMEDRRACNAEEIESRPVDLVQVVKRSVVGGLALTDKFIYAASLTGRGRNEQLLQNSVLRFAIPPALVGSLNRFGQIDKYLMPCIDWYITSRHVEVSAIVMPDTASIAERYIYDILKQLSPSSYRVSSSVAGIYTESARDFCPAHNWELAKGAARAVIDWIYA